MAYTLVQFLFFFLFLCLATQRNKDLAKHWKKRKEKRNCWRTPFTHSLLDDYLFLVCASSISEWVASPVFFLHRPLKKHSVEAVWGLKGKRKCDRCAGQRNSIPWNDHISTLTPLTNYFFLVLTKQFPLNGPSSVENVDLGLFKEMCWSGDW
jgi:hypothetical protein